MSGRCVFCQLARGSTEGRTSRVLYADDLLVAFEDIRPAAARHYLVIPVSHVGDVNSLQRGQADYQLVKRMVEVGRELLQRDAPEGGTHRFGFHRPPFNSVDHLHLHCLAPPYAAWWTQFKYFPLGRWGAFLDAEALLAKLRPP